MCDKLDMGLGNTTEVVEGTFSTSNLTFVLLTVAMILYCGHLFMALLRTRIPQHDTAEPPAAPARRETQEGFYEIWGSALLPELDGPLEVIWDYVPATFNFHWFKHEEACTADWLRKGYIDQKLALQYAESTLDMANRARTGVRFTDDGIAVDPLAILTSFSGGGIKVKTLYYFLISDARSQTPADLLRVKDVLREFTSLLLTLVGKYAKFALLLRTMHVAHAMLMDGAVTVDHLRVLEHNSRDFLTLFDDPADHEAFRPLIQWTHAMKE